MNREVQDSQILNPSALLRFELNRRISSRPRYSLRAFAKALQISPATLSLILSGKTSPSKRVIDKMIEKLDLSREQILHLKSGNGFGFDHVDRNEVQEVAWDIFSVFSDWYHFAILSLLELKGSSLDPNWLAKKLSISPTEAAEATNRLKRVGLITEVKGRWKQSGGHIRMPPQLSSMAAKKFQKRLLLKAIDSLEQDPPETRDISGMTFAMDANLLAYASKKITDFRRALTNELENKKSANAVYNLTIQLYPVTKENS